MIEDIIREAEKMYETTKENTKVKNQDTNLPFLTLEIGTRNTFHRLGDDRIQEWQFTEEISQTNEGLNKDIEQRLNDIDKGKEKLVKYFNVDDYLNHVDEVIKE